MWFWEVLGIEPTKDKTAIKRAYTKLARKTNPEDDPEGYSRLHDAYRAALDYATGRVVEVVEPVVSDGVYDVVPDSVSAGTKRSEFDFTSVNDTDQAATLDPTELRNYIHEFKVATKTFSYEEIFNRPPKELHDLAVRLFGMYSTLAVKADDPGVWDDFFSEPLINTVMNDTEFRYHMETFFPEGNINRFVITGFIDNYEQSVESHIQEEVRKKETEETLKKKEHARDWRALAFGCSAIGLILIFADLYYALYVYQLLSIGCTFIAFGLCCGARYFDKYLKITGTLTKMERSLSMFLKLGTVLFMVFGWAAIFEYGSLADIYGKTALVISCLTTIAVILLWTVFRPRLKKR